MKESIQNIGKYPSEVDVAVLLLFFTRVEQTVCTFEQIRRARPARLYLYQDGPRIGRQDDIENIFKCRKAVEEMIDWNCEVHKFYQEKNLGCDPSEFISQKWMFSTEEKGIIIEDDDVMSVSFFRFCKEMLDKYENDTRINIICGMNHLGIYEECPYDYFFVRRGGAIWGWASWRRVIDQWDSEYKLLESKYDMKVFEANMGKNFTKNYKKICAKHMLSGREHYESILGSYAYFNSTLNIVPKKNMTCNIGIATESTHSVDDIKKLPKAIRGLFHMKTYELEFPLKHPKCIQDEILFRNKLETLLKGNWFERKFYIRYLRSLFNRITSSI